MTRASKKTDARSGLGHRGLAKRDFDCIANNGFGDQLNAYPHSMTWFKDKLYVGTTRSNLCLFKVSKIKKKLDRWPVQCPDYVYDQDMRAQIWSYDPKEAEPGVPNSGWTLRSQAPWIEVDGEKLPREVGYRGMCVFQGESDDEPHMYVATYTPARGYGTRIYRTTDGDNYEEIPMPEGFDRTIITLRLIVPHNGWLFTSPTGKAGGEVNASGNAVIYGTKDPAKGDWKVINTPGFGRAKNIGIFEMIGCGDYLYAGTGNPDGYEIWRTKIEGEPPFNWECVVDHGAFRGPLNQGVASFTTLNGVVYAGGGIQHGGIDRANGLGPAGPELIRIHEDGSWDLLVGTARETPVGPKVPLSGYAPGFDNLFNGYFWQMETHDDWIYVGTFDWTVMIRYSEDSNWPMPFRKMIERYGMENLIKLRAGAELYRSRDGENWLPVTTQGFGNEFNYGIRTFQSTPHGLAVGFVNPFGPNVGMDIDDDFTYVANPKGGLEIWLGHHEDE